MIVGAAGAEEQHTSNALAVGMWASPVTLEIDLARQHTGAACFHHVHPLGQGGSPQSASQTKGWWSFADYFTEWGDGTYRYIFKLCPDDDGRFIGWLPGTVEREAPDDIAFHSKLALFDGGPNTLADSGAVEATKLGWSKIKIEFDNGNWIAWGYLDGDTQWRELFTYDDTGNFTTMTTLRMDLNSSTDETKGQEYCDHWVDDCVFWDAQGDNWNSRIATLADFPRISAPHLPTANGEWDDLDEVPPDHASTVGADDEDAYYDVEALNIDGDPDYTDGYIQAVMVTRCDYALAENEHFRKFNVYDGAAVHTDSEEDDRKVQVGFETVDDWWTTAGYYPWTIAEENWTEALFNTYEYGCYVLEDITDQLTVQVIYFGDGWEWTPAEEEAAHIRQGVAIGSANAMMFAHGYQGTK